MEGMNGIARLERVNHAVRLGAPERVRLVNLNDIFSVSMKNRFGVPAINVRAFPLPKEGNFEIGYLGPSTVVSALRAAKEMNAPLIIEIAQSEFGYCGPKKLFGEEGGFNQLVKHILVEADRMGVRQPFAIHFDHGNKVELMRNAVKAGFSSVALDGGKIESWDKLVEEARAWVNYCHPLGVTVEGEIETVGGQDPTDPQQAIEFVKLTGVDVIVVTLPENVHGAERGKSKLDLPRLLEVANAVNIPVNLHGGSGFSLEDLSAAVNGGGAHKVNYATNVMREMFKAVPRIQEILADRALAAGILKPEKYEKAKTSDPKDAREGLFLLSSGGESSVIATMGINEVRAAEDAMTAEIIKVMKALNNVNTAGLYI